MTFEIDIKEVSLFPFFLFKPSQHNSTQPQLGRKCDKKMKMLIT